jgi:hypothetical protein
VITEPIVSFEKVLKPGPIESTPLVKGLSGVIKLAEDFDYRKERGNQLERKHL